MLLLLLVPAGYPVELLPVNKTASSVVRVLHAFKGDVAARGLETARRSAWAAYGHRVGYVSCAGHCLYSCLSHIGLTSCVLVMMVGVCDCTVVVVTRNP